MAYEVRTISQIDNKNIKLGKTFNYSLGGDGNYHLTNIYYINPSPDSATNTNSNIPKETDSKRQDAIDDKTKLIIQTPLMFIPNSMVYFNEKPFLELSFNNEKNDKEVSEFKTWISNLETYIYKLIKRRLSLNIEKSNMNSILKNGYGSNPVSRLIVPINMNVSKCILNDDSKKSKLLFNWEIPVPTYAISIIWVKNIWIKKGKWGLNLFMYASRVMNSHILDPIDFMGFDNDSTNNSNSNKTIKLQDVSKQFKTDEKTSLLVGQVPEYTMFFKMLKMGIPKEAVKQKMTLLNLDDRYIDYPDTTPYVTVIHYISNPKLGPYVKPKVNDGSGVSGVSGVSGLPSLPIARPSIQLDLLKNITGGFKLKKVEKDKDDSNSSQEMKDKILNKINKNNSNGLKVPSLGDIQGALSRLKKVELDVDDSDT